ncbi:MAG: internalin, partial [Acidobacteriota bacterium]|nr:internalin [Acidobacteriota bacterium]
HIKDLTPLMALTKLTTLDLTGNQITGLTPLMALTNLATLYLSGNQITGLTPLRELKHLNTLDVHKNLIRQLPPDITSWWPDMEIKWEDDILFDGLNLFGNPLEKPPLEIIKKGGKAIKAYFDSLKEDTLPLNEVKVLLVGDGAAGKTSLAKLLLGLPFDKHEPQTHGINIDDRTFQVGDQEIITHLWDFGGQEIMHATHQFFLSKRSLYILVLDGRKEEKTEYWLKHIESFGKDSPVLVVLNKIDENPGFEVNRKFLLEKYPNIKGFFRISCETRKGIETFSYALEDQLSRLDMLKTTWAATWFNVKTYLEKMRDPFISYSQYLDICRTEYIAEKTGQETLVEFLHDLGTVLYFKDLELEDTHVLQPGWVTTAVYKIINSPLLANCGGVLKLDLLGEILASTSKDDYHYPPDKYRYIIQLMKKFELCYDLDRDRVLTPDLLPVEEPSFDFPYGEALQLIIRYDFLPRSILPRFMVRQHKDIKGGLQWRTGVLLAGEIFQSTAVVKVDEGKHTIYIYVHGGQEKYYLAVLRHTFKDINSGFDKLGESERVPLPDDPDVTVSYDHLLRLRDMKQTHYIPEGAAKEYLIADLLHDYEENKHSSLASLIDKRWQVLNDLDQRISDPHTLEKDLHKLLEKNLWILGTEYDPLSSDESLKTQVEEYLGKEYRGERARKRPDLVLARDSGQRFLLLELKKPGHILTRQDGAQAQTYADELNQYLPQVKIEVVVLGGKVDSTLTARNQGQEVKYLSYRQVVSNARRSLEWLLGDMKKD